MLVAMGIEEAQRYLAEHRNPDGSWGYLPGGDGRPEPTVLAAAAGGDVKLAWLEAQDLGWTRMLLPAALSLRPDAEALRERCLDELLALEGRKVQADPVLGFDPEISAWPWRSDTAPWVEPTAYAVLSLKRCGRGAHPRTAQGEAMLLDRQCADGGWNTGNPAVFDTDLESYLPTTGWALLALSPGPAVDRGLERMLEARRQPSTLTLSLAILSRVAHGVAPFELPEVLAARQRPDGGFGGRVDWTALATCALLAASGGPQPFTVGGGA